MTQTRRRTLLPWMGGKSKSAAFIISRIPEHTTYVEPFCGGCAVFFRKPRTMSKAEVLNDADGRLVTLLRVFRDALAQPGITDIQRAARFLLVIKAAFGAKIASPSFGYGLAGKAHFNHDAVASLVAAARDRLDGVTIENLDFEEVIRRYDSPATPFYCDPPYIGTEGYACKFTIDDHRRLRDALAAAKGKALVSLNDCGEARELYAGWDIQDVAVTYSVGGKGVDRGRKNREVLMVKRHG